VVSTRLEELWWLKGSNGEAKQVLTISASQKNRHLPLGSWSLIDRPTRGELYRKVPEITQRIEISQATAKCILLKLLDDKTNKPSKAANWSPCRSASLYKFHLSDSMEQLSFDHRSASNISSSARNALQLDFDNQFSTAANGSP
jgi:hypothetical protein